MPAKFRNKTYLAETCYHIYNRGLDGREVFGEDEDYQKFLQIIGRYLVKEKDEQVTIYKEERPYLKKRRKQMNLADQIELLAICLMPDHYHLLIRQKTADAMPKLMRRAITHYSMYYNKKYQRSGPLFENVYRAVVAEPGEKALLLTKYIHTNPVSRQIKRFGLVETSAGFNPEYYMYSSYGNYLGNENAGVDREMIQTARVKEWLKQSSWGRKGLDYRGFVNVAGGNWKELLGELIIEIL